MKEDLNKEELEHINTVKKSLEAQLINWYNGFYHVKEEYSILSQIIDKQIVSKNEMDLYAKVTMLKIKRYAEYLILKEENGEETKLDNLIIETIDCESINILSTIINQGYVEEHAEQLRKQYNSVKAKIETYTSIANNNIFRTSEIIQNSDNYQLNKTIQDMLSKNTDRNELFKNNMQ